MWADTAAGARALELSAAARAALEAGTAIFDGPERELEVRMTERQALEVARWLFGMTQQLGIYAGAGEAPDWARELYQALEGAIATPDESEVSPS